MILVMLGTSPYPFSRLLDAVGDYARKEGVSVIAQSGSTPPVDDIKCHPFLGHDALMRLIVEADVVVAQGGFGSLSDCIAVGAKTVAVPRKAQFGEAMHDQSELVDALADEGLVVPLYDVTELPEAIGQAQHMKRPVRRESALQQHIAETIRSLIEGA